MKKTFRNISFCILVMTLLIGVTGCNNSRTVKIGLLTDITGRSSLLGVSGRNALELAVDEYNKGNHTYDIQLVIKDDKGLPEEVKKVMDEFNEEGINLIIGPYTSNIAQELIDEKLNTSNKTLFLSPTVSSSIISDLDDNFIALLNSNDQQGIILAQKAYSNGLRKMATIYENNNRSYSEPLAKAFEETFKNLGGEIVYANRFISSQEAPFLELTNEIGNSGAEGVLIIAGGLDASQFIQFIHKYYPDLQLFSGMWAKTADFISNGGKAVEGTYITGISEGDPNNQSFDSLKKLYYNNYNSELTFPVICTYEAAQILFEAMELTESTDPTDIKKAILESSQYTGLSNDLKLDEYGDSIRPYILYEVRKGKYIKVTE